MKEKPRARARGFFIDIEPPAGWAHSSQSLWVPANASVAPGAWDETPLHRGLTLTWMRDNLQAFETIFKVIAP